MDVQSEYFSGQMQSKSEVGGESNTFGTMPSSVKDAGNDDTPAEGVQQNAEGEQKAGEQPVDPSSPGSGTAAVSVLMDVRYQCKCLFCDMFNLTQTNIINVGSVPDSEEEHEQCTRIRTQFFLTSERGRVCRRDHS